MLCYVMLCYVMLLCYVNNCYVMLCYVMLCYVMLCQAIHNVLQGSFWKVFPRPYTAAPLLSRPLPSPPLSLTPSSPLPHPSLTPFEHMFLPGKGLGTSLCLGNRNSIVLGTNGLTNHFNCLMASGCYNSQALKSVVFYLLLGTQSTAQTQILRGAWHKVRTFLCFVDSFLFNSSTAKGEFDQNQESSKP